MINWIMENFSTIVISAVLLIVVIWIIAGIIKKQKQGKTACGCGCDHCASEGNCHG